MTVRRDTIDVKSAPDSSGVGDVGRGRIAQAEGEGRCADKAGLAVRKFRGRINEIQHRDMASLFDMKGEFHVARFHADHRKVEKPFADEFGLSTHISPLWTVGRQLVIGDGDLHLAAHAGVFVDESEAVEQRRFWD
jgi:hypothetical protein